MKILSLKALNINSLKGTTEIDFQDLTKESALFAITGPTGSGKSTLLDIISCALYGRTSRLKNPNDLMSRHCGEAYCEVEFQIHSQKYRSSWTQKRARNKHDGKFQTAKMELVDLNENKVLDLKSREVPKKIEELSGLDFGRFTQSMLLAQGGFDAFLKADEKERSALLEKITGTRIYADISIAIFDKHRNLLQEMDSDLKILESIELLDEETIERKQTLLEENIQEKHKTDEALKELNFALQWIQKLSELILESNKYEEDFIAVSNLKEENKESFTKLSLANKAVNISSTFTSFTLLKESLGVDRTTSITLSKEIETLHEDIKKKDEVYTLVQKELQKETQEFEIQKQKLKLAREIQTQEKSTVLDISRTQVSLESKKKSLVEVSTSLHALLATYKQIQEQIETKKSYLKNNAKDEKLISTLGIIGENISRYEDEEKNLNATQKKLKLLSISLLEEESKHKNLKEKTDELTLALQEKELAYKKLDDESLSDVQKEESIGKSLQDLELLQRTLDTYLGITKKRDNEQKEYELYLVNEKSLLETQVVLQEHIQEIKKHIETLRAKKEKEQELKKYEEDRVKLIEGEACSLCGSTSHPYASESCETHIDETETMISSQLQELEEKEQNLKELVSRLVAVQTKIETSKLEFAKLDKEKENLRAVFTQYSFEPRDDSKLQLIDKQDELTSELHFLKQNRIKKEELLKQRDRVREELQTQEKSYSELNAVIQRVSLQKEQVSSTLASHESKTKEYLESLNTHFKEFELSLETIKIETQFTELSRRKNIYTETLEALRVLESELNRCEVDKKESQTKEVAINAGIESDSKYLKELEESSQKLSASRIEILNVADLEAHEKEINTSYEKIQKQEQDSKETLNELITKSEERSSYKKALDTKIVENETKLQELSTQLKELYAENNFKNEQEFQTALLSNEERTVLLTLCKSIEDKYTQTQTLQVQSALRLKTHQEEPLSERPSEELETMQSLLEQKVNALQESIGSDKKELEINKDNSDKHKERISSLQKKKEAFKVWIKLNELVGSADGTKFKKFAQGITLDQLINLANQHLNILSSRYTLTRSENKLLELEVVDAYQGNVVRPVSTLSGGESFIVSLALALGLSELASQKIAIDSLFLDEGFGTLDQESLETALNALNLLQSGGKMVGVISHVEALKERIPLQIKVVPRGDGTSFVEIV